MIFFFTDGYEKYSYELRKIELLYDFVAIAL